MSQPPSSSDPEQAGNMAESQMRALLGEYLAQDLKPTFFKCLLTRLSDPFEKGKDGGFKLNSVWIALGVFAALVLSVFLYFSFLRR
jgi:hypothetical protein